MSGSIRLSEEEKAEMRLETPAVRSEGTLSGPRGRRREAGTLDDYIDFLSENMPFVPPKPPRVHVTKDFRL